jgi:hypothetical protein
MDDEATPPELVNVTDVRSRKTTSTYERVSQMKTRKRR